MNVPRKHHYVPNFYLKGFTKEGTEDGRIWVTDTKLKNQWPSSPKNSASEKDFYRAQLVQHPDPMWFEKLMANQVEPQLSSILQPDISHMA